jgi:hypothetical protein
VVKGRKSYVEALGQSSSLWDECFNSNTKPIAKIPRWLKEASAELGLQVYGRAMAPKVNTALAKTFGNQG